MGAYTHGARPWTVLAFLARTLLAVDETQNVPRAEKSEGHLSMNLTSKATRLLFGVHPG